MSRILNIKTTERKRNVGLNITEKTPECVTPVDYFMMVAADSMKDAGIEEGDKIKVSTGIKPHDSDIVAVKINEAVLLMALFTDHDGVQWLVPQNPDYEALRLDEIQEDVAVMGVVSQVTLEHPRVSFRACAKVVNQTKQHMTQTITPDKVRWVIGEMAKEMTVARWWFAVYRAMADTAVLHACDIERFCQMVRTEVPQHPHLPDETDLHRMEVGCFRKPMTLWEDKEAPVSGKRFRRYLDIAQRTKDWLTE